jgi:hypothetical protein
MTVEKIIEMLSTFPKELEVKTCLKGYGDVFHTIDVIKVEHVPAYKEVVVVIHPVID